MKRRRRKKNPGSYWVNFALAACAVIAVLYFVKRAQGAQALPPPQ